MEALFKSMEPGEINQGRTEKLKKKKEPIEGHTHRVEVSPEKVHLEVEKWS